MYSPQYFGPGQKKNLGKVIGNIRGLFFGVNVKVHFEKKIVTE